MEKLESLSNSKSAASLPVQWTTSVISSIQVNYKSIYLIRSLSGTLNNQQIDQHYDPIDVDEKQLNTLSTFIKKICSPPILDLQLLNLPYSVDTDASTYGIGCTMFQINEDGTLKQIGYWSRSVNDAEFNYSAPEHEFLAVVWELQTLRPYLQYETFTVYTNHNALNWLFNITEPSGSLTCW